jgi:Polysaccharide lyase/PKD domain
MFALFLGSVVFIASCKKDTSVDTPITDQDAVIEAAARASGNPVAKAGADQSITLPVSSATFDGSSSYDANGSISAYAWTKEVGPAATITSASAARTTVTGLANGEYRFKLKVTDNSGNTATDTVHLSVKGSGGSTPPPTGGNQSPVVNAGNAQTITLPISSVTLNGSATDADGTVASYLWTKVSGTGGTITSPNTAATTVTGLTAGSYVFNLKATDNAGASGNKTVTITVNSGTTTPPPTGGNYGTLLYSTGYNTNADLDPYDNGQIGSGSLSTSMYVTGPGSFKSVPANVSAGIRSEVQYPSSLTPTEGAIEYDVRYETIFQNSGHSLQFHPNTSGGSASPGLWHENGKFVWVNWKGGTNTKYPTNFTIPQNKWMHVVFEYKIGSAGYMKFTIDGVVVLDKTNIQVGDGSGQYLKVGVNMWASQSSTVYYDNLKIWKK